MFAPSRANDLVSQRRWAKNERVSASPTSVAAFIRTNLHESSRRVRAGLHTGGCEIIDDDVGAIAVRIGVAAIAGAGEVLMSSTVTASYSVKGVLGEWRIFAVERLYPTLAGSFLRAKCLLWV
jgi:hypothetical protein